MRPPTLANILVMALLVFALLSLWAKVGRAQTFDVIMSIIFIFFANLTFEYYILAFACNFNAIRSF
jgi:hypothetical protein